MSFSFMAAVTACSDFEVPQNKVCHYFHCSLSVCHEMMGPEAMILVFQMLSFKPVFSLSSFTFIKRLFNASSLSAVRELYSMNIQGWFPLGLTGLISLLSKRRSRIFFQHHSLKAPLLWHSASLWSNSYICT